MTFFGPIVPEVCRSCACGWGGFFQALQNLLNVGISLAIVFAVLMIVYGGFLLVMSPTNPGNRDQAKSAITSALIGLVIVLGAWLIINTVMNALYNGTFGPWNSIISGTPADCLKVGAADTSTVDTSSGTPQTSTPASSASSCTTPSNANNPCSVQSLSGTCFAASGEAASQVCNLESRGQAAIPSGSDKLEKGQGPSYSWGLWQINLTTTKVGGLNCPSAFSHPCSGQYIHNQGKVGWCDSEIINQDLYAQCVRAAQDPQKNTQAACSLYNSTLSAWACSASRCSVPGAKVLSGTCAPGN